MDNPILSVAMRYIHIVSAIIAVGGMAFMLFCVSPAVRLLDDKLRESLVGLMHSRFQRVVWFCIAGLVISGTYTWILFADDYKKMGPMGNALIGTKVLLAIIMFAVVGARSMGMMKNARAALMINIHLGAIVILLGGILRYLHLKP